MRRSVVPLAVALTFLVAPAGGAAATLRVRASHVPRRGFSSLRLIRAADGRIVANRKLRRRQSLSVPSGVYVAAAEVIRLRHRALTRAKGTEVRRKHTTRLSLGLRAARALAAASGSDAVVASQGVTLTGAGQPDVSLDGAIGGYLWTALHSHGVRVVDRTPEFLAAVRTEQRLSDQGRLEQPFQYNPLTPNYFVHGKGTVHKDGTVFLELRVVDATGAVVALASGRGKGSDLRSLVVKTVNDVSARAAPTLAPQEPGRLLLDVQPYGCGVGSTSSPSQVTVSPAGTETDRAQYTYDHAPETITLTAEPQAGCVFGRFYERLLGDRGTCRDTSATSCTVQIDVPPGDETGMLVYAEFRTAQTGP